MITLTLSGICENCPYYDIIIKEFDFSTNCSFKIMKPVAICKFKHICERIEKFYTGKAHDENDELEMISRQEARHRKENTDE